MVADSGPRAPSLRRRDRQHQSLPPSLRLDVARRTVRDRRLARMRPMRTALLLGATGLVGAALLERLAGDTEYERVTSLIRRPASAPSAKVQMVVVDYD